MREIKLRAWDKILKKMHYWSLKDIWESELMPNFDDYIVMQCTGITDKNNREIFEGDILDGKFTDLIIVKFEEICSLDEGCYIGYEFCSTHAKKLEIIGNIYENPELIEE